MTYSNGDLDPVRDHGGDLDAALRQYGGTRAQWIDLSTGINPIAYPVPSLSAETWMALPDKSAQERLIAAARNFWRIPPSLGVLAAPGASALIAAIPSLAQPGCAYIPGPTYNEHAAAFRAAGWQVQTEASPPARAEARVIVHPNNPDGAFFEGTDLDRHSLTVIDESFCDPVPQQSLQALAHRPGTIVLKSFGKFWGLAGLRLGFAIASPQTIRHLADRLGPWAVSGPALQIGARALLDPGWAEATRNRLTEDARRLDDILTGTGRAHLVGGTPLFRLYQTRDAKAAQAALARHHVWTRRFPYSDTWLRLGLPGHAPAWERLRAAVLTLP